MHKILAFFFWEKSSQIRNGCFASNLLNYLESQAFFLVYQLKPLVKLHTMVTQLPIKFLQQKITELQTALFFTDSDAVLRIPTHVITAAEMDEAGQIWFFIPRPVQHIDAFDQDFPVKLDFFRKGKDFYLKIQGTASFVTSKKELKEIVSAEIERKIENKEVVAIRVAIRNADYFENIPKPASVNWIITGKNHLYNWLFNSQYDYKNPQLITIPIIMDHRKAYLK